MPGKSSGTIFTWKLSAKNSPARIARFRRHIQAAQTNSNTITGSVFPMKAGNHQRNRAEREKRQSPSWNMQIRFCHAQQNQDDEEIGDNPRQPKKKWKMDTNVLTPALFG